MTLPLHSICIPAYNHETYVTACLQSILRQTYPRLELLIVDDGSQDHTADRIESFLVRHSERFERVEFHRQQNRGIVPTCNRLLDMVRGEWLHLVASDDLFYPNKVERQWQAFLDWGVETLAVVHADMHMIDDGGEIIGELRAEGAGEGPVFNAWEKLLLNNYVKAPTAMVNAGALRQVGGYPEGFRFEDYACWLRLSLEYPIGRIPEFLCGYRWHGGNISSSREDMLVEWVAMQQYFVEAFSDRLSPKSVRRCFRKNIRRVRRVATLGKGDLGWLYWRLFRTFWSTPGGADFDFLNQLLKKSPTLCNSLHRD